MLQNFQLHLKNASPEFQLAAGIAEFAEILGDSFWAQGGNLNAVHQVIGGVLPQVRDKQTEELVHLVNQAARLKAWNAERIR